MTPMIKISKTQKAAMRPASAALIDDPTSWVNTRHADNALKETEDKTFTLPLSRRSRKYPIPAITKIGTTSEIRMERRLDTGLVSATRRARSTTCRALHDENQRNHSNKDHAKQAGYIDKSNHCGLAMNHTRKRGEGLLRRDSHT